MSVFGIVAILYIIFIAGSYLLEMYKVVSSIGLSTWIVIGALLLIMTGLALYYYYYHYNDGIETEEDENDFMKEKDSGISSENNWKDVNAPNNNTSVSQPPAAVSLDNLTLLEFQDFKIKNTGDEDDISLMSSSTSLSDEITYEDFKKMIDQPAFINEFTSAIKICLDLKKTKYAKLKVQAVKEMVMDFLMRLIIS